MAEHEDHAIAEALKNLGITEDRIYQEVDVQATDELNQVAEDVRTSWAAKSPYHTGTYIADIQIVDMKDNQGHPARRVVDVAPYAHIIEYGSKDEPAHNIRATVATEFHNEGNYTI